LCTFGLIPSLDLGHLSFHLFEANPNLIRYLEKSKGLFPSAAIQVVEGSICDRPGDLPVSARFPIHGTFSCRSEWHLNRGEYCAGRLPGASADRSGDLFKMNLEVQELSALRGLSKAFSRGAIKVIYFFILRSGPKFSNDMMSCQSRSSISCTRTDFVFFTARIVI
jgi:hypothetical protein